MDIFQVREQLIDDYRQFTSSFVKVLEPRLAQHVDDRMKSGEQWPDPWLSLNPNFAPGGSTAELVRHGLLHQECDRIFRIKQDPADPGTQPLYLYQHQREAIEAAATGGSYVLTTGTGSGKSLGYIIPIVDRVLRTREAEGPRRGVKAIVVYPMNALANSQMNELEKFLQYGYPEGGEPVTFARYTGQEGEEKRQQILNDPPDILLTNYVMLELVLTRPREREHLVRAARGLQFLVLDELHTYRGRQGADVAMLTRRLRDACAAPDLQCVGTSATMSTATTLAGQRQEVADVATRLFGDEVTPDRVIVETLKRVTQQGDPDIEQLRRRITEPAPQPTYEQLTTDPLMSWVESAFGITTGAETGRLVRQRPRTVQEAATELAATTGASIERCVEAIRDALETASHVTESSVYRPTRPGGVATSPDKPA